MPVGQRYPILPIPWVPEHTELVPAGVVTVGVEYRVLDDSTATPYLESVGFQTGAGDSGPAPNEHRDAGVSLHVFGPDHDGDGSELVEYLRFDCFDEEPHYHYVYNDDGSQDRVFLDPIVEGDPMEWALDRLRTRMPDVLRKVGAPRLAARVDPDALDGAIPAVRAAVARALSGSSQAPARS